MTLEGDRWTRPAAVAGRFYPSDPRELAGLVRRLLEGAPREARRAPAAVVPHAGLEYSGACAARVFCRLELPATVVILAPDHTGSGARGTAALWPRGAFETPLGLVPIAEAFASRLQSTCDLVLADPVAHQSEHAIEVELPFLQLLAAGTAIVPLVLAWDDWERSARLARALAELIRAGPDPVLLVASSDLTHYEPIESARQKDRVALAAVEGLDGQGLLEVCRRDRITMCGRAPAAVACEAARQLGATRGDVVDYRHSGLVTGDDRSVVSYSGVILC
jgi:AmmeMemoRadiSam system protein B